MKGVKVEQAQQQTIDEWFSGNNDLEMPNFTDNQGASFIFDLDYKCA